MKLKTLYQSACIILASCWLQPVLAQNPVPGTENDYHWRGLGTFEQWPDNNNWEIWTNLNNQTPPVMVDSGLQGAPVSGGANFVGSVFLDAANGVSHIVVPAGDTESPGVPPPGSAEEFNTIFGPEFGATLDVYGTLNFDWTIAPTQPDPNPANRSYLNIYTNAVLNCVGAGGNGGASLNLGDGWWPFLQNSPYVTVNMYGNAQYNSPGGAGLWLGGHLNIYDTASFYVNGYVNMDVIYSQSDGTRSLVLGGGKLTLPENTITTGNSGSVYDWIARGILRAYGKAYDTNDLVISDNGTNTIVTPVPLDGALQRVYFQPLLKSTVAVGTFQQATLVGDYPSVSGVLLSSAEPGISPASYSQPIYSSSNPNVATINSNGMVTAIAPGTATLTATVGLFSSTNSLAITVTPVTASLIHRYSFDESPGSTTTADSIGGADGIVNGDATFSGSGQLVLSGNQSSSVILPAGIISNLDEVTIETWVSFPSTINAFANLWAFGFSDTIPFDPNNGLGGNYITFSPHTGGGTAQANFAEGVPGFNGERDAVWPNILDNRTNVQVVAVFHPYAGTESLYVNGALVSQNSMFNNMIDPVAFNGPTYNGKSILNYTIGSDPTNFIGESLYTGDPGLLANVDDFRIYNGPLTASQIAADYALGPNQVIGTNLNVALSESTSSNGMVLKWPTSSALVTLVSSPVLGSGAVWTPVSGTLTTDGNGNYQITISATNSMQYFRLQQ